MARPPITNGRRKNPPSICCQVTGCPIRGSHLSGADLKYSAIGLVFSFHSLLSFFEKDSFSGSTVLTVVAVSICGFF